MNRVVFASLTILCLLSASSITGLIQLVKADGGTITINADGSITPSTAPITTVDNITYTFTANIINESIVVERDSIVVDGQDYTVQGTGNGTGITLSGRSNVTIKDTKITTFDYGIELDSSSNNTLSGNNVTASSGDGILLSYSSNYNSISGNNITNNGIGVLLNPSSNYNSISGNNITANSYVGIYLDSSDNNNLSSNDVTANSGDGISLDSSDNNNLSGNNVTANSMGGIGLSSFSDNNTLSGNTIANNVDGIVLGFSSNNTIYHNNFINNTSQVYSLYTTNTWDNGSRGNYWSDYLTKYPNATQVDSSGVWNTPYVIGDENNTDNHPLMVPYAVIPEFPSFLILPLFMIATLLAVIIYKKKGVKTSQS